MNILIVFLWFLWQTYEHVFPERLNILHPYMSMFELYIASSFEGIFWKCSNIFIGHLERMTVENLVAQTLAMGNNPAS